VKEFNRQFNRVFVTGDIHGSVADLSRRVKGLGETTRSDLLILLGDCGFFFDCFYKKDSILDRVKRMAAAALPITVLCVQGNHDQPFSEMDAKKIRLLGGAGYERDGIYFAENGTVLNLNGFSALVFGGAHSMDKEERQALNNPYFKNEELSMKETDKIIAEAKGKTFDFIFSHTCPSSDMAALDHALNGGLNKTPSQTERALETLRSGIEFGRWFCGHFHIEKELNGIRFMFRETEKIL
jgi:3-oxoacid CoA-transferase subunit A